MLNCKNIIVNIEDIFSLVSLNNDDLGEEDGENNMVCINSHFDERSGEQSSEPLLLSLLGDANRDKSYMDWVLAKKGSEDSTTADF